MCNGFISGNSISLPGKKNILSVNLLNKSLKRKVYNYLLNSQSAKIITVALLKELSVFPFSHISFVREYWTVSGPCSLLKSKSIRQILGNFHNSYFCLQKPFGYNEDQRQKPLFFFPSLVWTQIHRDLPASALPRDRSEGVCHQLQVLIFNASNINMN